MIRAITTSPERSRALQDAAASKGYGLEIEVDFDLERLSAHLDSTSVLVLDFIEPAFNKGEVLRQLDGLDPDKLPPVLYLLDAPESVSLVAAAEHIVNQDYTFAPVTADNVALRLEVLTLLGARRRLTLESAITDKLTGLSNRKYFLRRLEEELYRAGRYGYGVGAILVDIDFSAPGGELSEADGTAAIQRIAEFFRGRLRRTDIVARFRWSEFGVLLPDIPAEDSRAVARDIKAKIEALEVESGGHKLTLRADVAHISVPAEGLATALQVAEALEDLAFAARRDGTAGVADYAGSGS